MLEQAKALDQQDPLRGLRQRFVLNEGEVYLDGNSLGALPVTVQERINHTLEHEWGVKQIRSWNEAWIDLPQQTGQRIAPLIGAEPTNVVCADSVSVNLFKLIAAALQSNPERHTVLSVQDMFPTDLYIAQGLEQLLGIDRCQVELTDIRELSDALNSDINVVVLSQINFRTGEAYDVRSITEQIHACGARVIWDVSHSVGVLPIEIADNQVDYAVGCGYKFLNGGPGAPSFVYVRRDLQTDFNQPLSGWMGHKDPFAFVNQYEPAQGTDRLLSGTPNILSLAALHEAMSIYENLDLLAVFAKAQGLTDFFIQAIKQSPALSDLKVIEQTNRGAQVSLRHPEAYAIVQALIANGVIGDFRSPDIARFGFAPLYVSYVDVADGVTQLISIMQDELYKQAEYQAFSKVT